MERVTCAPMARKKGGGLHYGYHDHYAVDGGKARVILEVLVTPADVTVLGDGEFDGIDLQATVTALGWQYACRTATSTKATGSDETFALSELGACLKPGRLIELKEVAFTPEAYGPVMVLCCWAKGHAEPL